MLSAFLALATVMNSSAPQLLEPQSSEQVQEVIPWRPSTVPWASEQGQFRVFEIRTDYEFQEVPYNITSRVLERVVVQEDSGESVITVQPLWINVRTPEQERRTFPNRDDNFRLGSHGEVLGTLADSAPELIRYTRLVSFVAPGEAVAEALTWMHTYAEDTERELPETVFSARVVGAEERGGLAAWRVQVSVDEMRSEVASAGTVWILREGGQVIEAEWEIAVSPYPEGPRTIRTIWRQVDPDSP